MKRRNASQEEHDAEINDRNGFVNSNLRPAPGLRVRAGRPKSVEETSINGPGPRGFGGVVMKKLKKKKQKGSQGSITFEKILHATSSPACGSRANLTVPAWFIKEHGDELQGSVVLRCAATKKEWTVQVGIYYPRNIAQVKFYSGWREFACSNGLGEGDLLVFCLRKVSQFDVYIYRKAGGPDSAPSLPDAEPPRKRSKTLRASKRKYTRKAKQSDTSLDELLATEQVTDHEAKPNSLVKPSADAAPRQIRNDHPSFIKRIVASNLRDAAGYESGACLEIPRRFATTHIVQFGKSVKLQGMSEGSPVRVVACRPNVQQGHTRLYLRTGWSNFVSDNNLRLGQMLVFTLTGYSTFTVKEAPTS